MAEVLVLGGIVLSGAAVCGVLLWGTWRRVRAGERERAALLESSFATLEAAQLSHLAALDRLSRAQDALDIELQAACDGITRRGRQL